MDSNAEIALIGLVGLEGVRLFTGFLPDPSDVRKAEGDPVFAADVHTGEMMGALVVGGISLGAAVLLHNPAPLAIGVMVTLTMIVSYEALLRFSPAAAHHAANR